MDWIDLVSPDQQGLAFPCSASELPAVGALREELSVEIDSVGWREWKAAIGDDACGISCVQHVLLLKRIHLPRQVFATVIYLNYQFTPSDDIAFRPEFFDDMEGQRTGMKTRYATLGLGWQHWFSRRSRFVRK